MKLRDLSFLLIVTVAFGGTYLLSFVGRAPELPADQAHTVPAPGRNVWPAPAPPSAALERAGKHTAKWRPLASSGERRKWSGRS